MNKEQFVREKFGAVNALVKPTAFDVDATVAALTLSGCHLDRDYRVDEVTSALLLAAAAARRTVSVRNCFAVLFVVYADEVTPQEAALVLDEIVQSSPQEMRISFGVFLEHFAADKIFPQHSPKKPERVGLLAGIESALRHFRVRMALMEAARITPWIVLPVLATFATLPTIPSVEEAIRIIQRLQQDNAYLFGRVTRPMTENNPPN